MRLFLGSRLSLLGDEDGVDVGENSALGDGDTAQKLVQLLVVADGQLDVAGHDSALLVVTSGIAGELKDLGSQVLEDGGKVHGGTSSDAGSEAATLEESADTADGELKSSLNTSANRLLGVSLTTTTLSSFSSFGGHFTIKFNI